MRLQCFRLKKFLCDLDHFQLQKNGNPTANWLKQCRMNCPRKLGIEVNSLLPHRLASLGNHPHAWLSPHPRAACRGPKAQRRPEGSGPAKRTSGEATDTVLIVLVLQGVHSQA